MNVNWLVQSVASAFVVLVFLALIKWSSNKFNVPVVKDISNMI